MKKMKEEEKDIKSFLGKPGERKQFEVNSELKVITFQMIGGSNSRM